MRCHAAAAISDTLPAPRCVDALMLIISSAAAAAADADYFDYFSAAISLPLIAAVAAIMRRR